MCLESFDFILEGISRRDRFRFRGGWGRSRGLDFEICEISVLILKIIRVGLRFLLG